MSLPSSSARRKLPHSALIPPGAISINNVTAGSDPNQFNIEFTQPLVLQGTPNFTLSPDGQTTTTAVQTGSATVLFTFSADVAGALTIVMAPFDPAIKGAQGQLFVPSLEFPI